MPTGSERTVWGMGDGSTLPVVDTPYGRLSGLTCWENYMPLTRFYLYSQGVDIWAAPTLATGDGWIATMRHIALRGPLLRRRRQPVHAHRPDPGRLPAPRPGLATPRDRTSGSSPATASSSTRDGRILAGPARHEETILYADIDLAAVRAARRYFDPVGHYHRPDIFQLPVDTRPRPPVVLREPPSDLSELS